MTSSIHKLRTPYAKKGETVYCTSGHPICDFVKTVYAGDTQNLDEELGNWRQDKPLVGTTKWPTCAICGCWFAKSPGLFHFKTGWRDPYRVMREG